LPLGTVLALGRRKIVGQLGQLMKDRHVAFDEKTPKQD
jgi:hypothetical protein